MASVTHPSFTLVFSNLQKNTSSSPSGYLYTAPSRDLKKIHRCLSISCKKDDKNLSSSTTTTTTITANNKTDQVRIMFTAGGTGGHIYPAVAIADDLKVINPNIQILFVGNHKGMESIAVPSTGYDFVSIPCFPIARPILFSPTNLLFPYRLITSMVKSWKVLKTFDPQIIVGTGGYVSAPICLTAALFRRGLNKLVIQEQNSVPGLANWLLSFFADFIFVAFPSSVKYFPNKSRCIISGNPIRLSLRKYMSKAVARMHFFPRAAKTWDLESRIVLILGGSLGANAINIAVLNMYSRMLSEHKNRFIIWQTGVDSFNEMESLVKNHPRLVLTPFMHKMDLAYAAADLVISRAGAVTCSEIMATGKPSILIPSPYVAEGHQMKNAFIMEDIAGSKVITEDELDSTTLGIAIEEILGDEKQMADMCEKALKSGCPEASAEIAQHILSLIN
ncbi:uncharacterized protein LOC113303127 isoform X1 [Papaver somniferum]|uniref:uncharacterized protein LOC113303127 isoform X1 n=2 Tax=Papaver somniferum TaxID=3469 RepID=UPI000E705BE6|nr:uncharacterized protein LOC113303127 isoform X1 [Papaver somniferum]